MPKNPSPELLKRLGISRASYYRLKKQGKLEERLKGLEESHSRYIEEWVQWREAGLYIRPWSKSYKYSQLLQIRRYFAKYTFVSSESLAEWLTEILPIKHSNRKDRYAAVSSLAKFLNLKGVLPQQEYMLIKALYPKKPPEYKPEQRIIYEDDFKILMEEAGKSHSSYQRLLNQTLLVLLSETALRATEACTLKLEDLRFSENPQEAFIRVVNGKGGKSRLVPFSRKAQETIKHYLHITRNRFKQGENLFQAYNPQHGFTRLTKDCLARRFKLLSQKTGIPFSAHSLRHYRITLWANNPRIPITVVQLWAGHSSLEVTQKYIHIRDVDALKAAF